MAWTLALVVLVGELKFCDAEDGTVDRETF